MNNKRACYFVLSVGQLRKAVRAGREQLKAACGVDLGPINCLVFEGVLHEGVDGGSVQVQVDTVRTPYTHPKDASRI